MVSSCVSRRSNREPSRSELPKSELVVPNSTNKRQTASRIADGGQQHKGGKGRKEEAAKPRQRMAPRPAAHGR